MSCPVCGWTPREETCPCCGFRFGLDDVGAVPRADLYRNWRTRWMDGGHPWCSRDRQLPDGWDPVEQLRSSGVTRDIDLGWLLDHLVRTFPEIGSPDAAEIRRLHGDVSYGYWVMVAAVAALADQPDRLRQFVDHLDWAMPCLDDDLEGVVSTGFVESLANWASWHRIDLRPLLDVPRPGGARQWLRMWVDDDGNPR